MYGPKPKTAPSKEKILKLYNDPSLSGDDIIEKLGCSRTIFYRWLKEYDIPLRHTAISNNRGGRIAVPPKEELQKEYSELLSMAEIARRRGVTQPTVRRWMKDYDIEIVDHKTASRVSSDRGRAKK